MAERDIEELRSYLRDCTVIFDSGFAKPIQQVKRCDIHDIINTVGMHVILMPIMAEVNQLISGLQFYGVLSLAKKFPSTMKPVCL